MMIRYNYRTIESARALNYCTTQFLSLHSSANILNHMVLTRIGHTYWRANIIFSLTAFHSTAFGQDMQPRVNITDTDPPSDGLRMRGFVAKDAWLNCYVENLDPDLSVSRNHVFCIQPPFKGLVPSINSINIY